MLGPYEDEVLRTAIHYFKYQNVRGAITPIRAWVKQYLTDLNARDWIEKNRLIVPIPLHPARFRKRGFNQAEMIGKVLSEELGLNMEIRGFRKIKNTDAQMGIKDRGKRKNNVKGCFVADGEQFSGRNILLVDDVYTSGATIREAAGALRKAGAKEIDVFVLAKAG